MSQIKLDKGNSKEYKVEAIYNTMVYVKESKDYLLGFYYLISWKSYFEKENT